MAGTFDELWRTSWGAASSGGPGFRSRHRVLLRLLERAGLDGALLDVGAGDGALLQRVERRFPWLRLSALETSAVARERLAALDLPVELLERVPGCRTFDAIVCAEVLEHLSDDEEQLAAMAGALVPGGRLFLTVPNRPDLWTRVDEEVGHLRRYEPGQLAAMCRRCGLQVEVDLAFGFPLYNAYYRLLGRRAPQSGEQLARTGAGAMTGLLAWAFVAEAALPSTRGGRGVVVARLPEGRS